MGLSEEDREEYRRESERAFLHKQVYLQHRREKLRKFTTWIVALTGGFYLVVRLTQAYYPYYDKAISRLNRNDLFVFVATILGITATLMVSYLENSKSRRIAPMLEAIRQQEAQEALGKIGYSSTFTKAELDSKFGMIARLIKQQSQAEPAISLSEAQKEEVYSLITSSISKNLTDEFFDHIKERVKSQVVEDRREQASLLTKRVEGSIIRLRNEVEALSRRANTNLVIGSIVTLSALAILTYFIVNEDFNSQDIVKVSLHFIPRLSLVLFIEFFSFFFLKLYRTSLHEIKYYQNELTNLEAKATAVTFAANYGSESDISSIIKEMSLTERNFKLQKGESTVELERNKLETHDLKEVVKALIGASASQKKKE